MNLDRLMWVFGALFVVFGLLMAVSNDTGARTVLGGLSVLSLGGFALAMVFDGIITGEIRVRFDVIKRATQPRLFWAVASLIGAAGMVVIIGGAWILFLKEI